MRVLYVYFNLFWLFWLGVSSGAPAVRLTGFAVEGELGVCAFPGPQMRGISGTQGEA